MKILKLKPAIKDNLWGGTKLSREWGIYAETDIQAEAWVLSCHKDGENIIEGGDFDGMTLTDVLKENPSYLGKNPSAFSFFPVLVKLIDACDNLSLQVHPSDEYALKNEGQYGKTECWYILEAEDDAEILYGLCEDLTKQQLTASIEDNSILEKVNHVKVKPGELYFIPSGTIHAICKGVLLAEVQQNSNITYRIFDYNRLQNGKPRELHKAQAAEVSNLDRVIPCGKPQGEKQSFDGYSETVLVSCELFTASVIDVETEACLTADDSSFVSLVCLDGNAVIEHEDSYITLYKGESVFVPASFGDFKVLGEVKILKTTV